MAEHGCSAHMGQDMGQGQAFTTVAGRRGLPQLYLVDVQVYRGVCVYLVREL